MALGGAIWEFVLPRLFQRHPAVPEHVVVHRGQEIVQGYQKFAKLLGAALDAPRVRNVTLVIVMSASKPVYTFSFGSLMVLAGAWAMGCASGGPGRDRDENVTPGPYNNVPGYGSQMPADMNTGDVPGGEMQDNDLPLDEPGQLGAASMGGTGRSTDRWQKADVTRNGQNYFLMANGWGPNFGSQDISWSGTSFTVESMTGSQGAQYQPASYPTVFCGAYSDSRSRECGLPAALTSMTSLRTGWSWLPNGNAGQYNAAYDIWLGNSAERSSHSAFMMVWYREPAGQQPAGRLVQSQVSVDNVPGTWDIWTGSVNNRPIINWVRREGEDTLAMEFDILDFVRDAEERSLMVPGTHVLSVAVGFEIWNGPVTNLQSRDFYVDVQ